MKLRQRNAARMFETRSHTWREAGLLRQIDARTARRARTRGVLFFALIVGVVLVNDNRFELLGIGHRNRHGDWVGGGALNSFVQFATVGLLLILGWALAVEIGRSIGPTFFRRMEPSTAGTVGFFVRLGVMALALFAALRTAGVTAASLTIGASFAAVIFGLAAQQTFGNVIAGMVLLSARPFRVGERVRLQAGGVGGQIEGIVSSLGLLYTTFATGEDLTMVPNSVVLNSAVIPLREPDSVDLRARLRRGVTPDQLQRLLVESIATPIRSAPRITLEELDGEQVVVRISATPRLAVDGPALATEVLRVVSEQTRPATADTGADAGGADGRASGAIADGD